MTQMRSSMLPAAILIGLLALPLCPAAAQTSKSSAPWSGIIAAEINATEANFSSKGLMDCKVTGSSARCTYTCTTEYSGKNPYVITESATQQHLQVSVVERSGEWKLLVAAFISKGTKTIKAGGKTMSGDGVNIQAPNWEVPLSAPRDPNHLFGSWKNPLGDVIKYDLSR